MEHSSVFVHLWSANGCKCNSS